QTRFPARLLPLGHLHAAEEPPFAIAPVPLVAEPAEALAEPSGVRVELRPACGRRNGRALCPHPGRDRSRSDEIRGEVRALPFVPWNDGPAAEAPHHPKSRPTRLTNSNEMDRFRLPIESWPFIPSVPQTMAGQYFQGSMMVSLRIPYSITPPL